MLLRKELADAAAHRTSHQASWCDPTKGRPSAKMEGGALSGVASHTEWNTQKERSYAMRPRNLCALKSFGPSPYKSQHRANRFPMRNTLTGSEVRRQPGRKALI